MPTRVQTSRLSGSGLLSAARRRALLLLTGLAIASVTPSISVAQITPVARPSPRDAYADHIAEASRRFGVPIANVQGGDACGKRRRTARSPRPGR